MCNKIYFAQRLSLLEYKDSKEVQYHIIGRYLDKDEAVQRCHEFNDGKSFLSVKCYSLGDCLQEHVLAKWFDVIHKPEPERIKLMEKVSEDKLQKLTWATDPFQSYVER